MGNYTKAVLGNGTRVLVDVDKRFSSAALAISIAGGLRTERKEQAGITHLLEHLLFKRTECRDTLGIASRIDDFGGEVNAYTDAESLCLHAAVPGEQAEDLLDFFAELLLMSAFTESELQVEREVVKQEIIEGLDDPGEFVYQNFSQRFWPDSMLGLPVCGSVESMFSASYADLRRRKEEVLRGKGLIIAASGNIDSDSLCRRAERLFASLPQGEEIVFSAPNPAAGVCLLVKPYAQAYVSLGQQWPSQRHPDYLKGLVLSAILGGTMSSRLFQLLREEHGMSYDIDTDVDAYVDAAALVTSLVVERHNLSRALGLILSEIMKVRENKITAEEFARAVRMHRASLSMERDSVGACLSRALESEIVHGRYLSVAEEVNELSQLSLTSFQDFVDEWLGVHPFQLVIGGDVEAFDLPESVLESCGGGEVEIL